MNKNQINKLEQLREEADTKMSQAGNAIHHRRKAYQTLMANIRGGKLAISTCHRACVSSRAAYWSVFAWIEKIKECEQVLKFLRGSLRLASEERYALDQALLAAKGKGE